MKGTGVEQDGSHESARRKCEDEERENVNKPLSSSAVRNYRWTVGSGQ